MRWCVIDWRQEWHLQTRAAVVAVKHGFLPDIDRLGRVLLPSPDSDENLVSILGSCIEEEKAEMCDDRGRLRGVALDAARRLWKGFSSISRAPIVLRLPVSLMYSLVLFMLRN